MSNDQITSPATSFPTLVEVPGDKENAYVAREIKGTTYFSPIPLAAATPTVRSGNQLSDEIQYPESSNSLPLSPVVFTNPWKTIPGPESEDGRRDSVATVASAQEVELRADRGRLMSFAFSPRKQSSHNIAQRYTVAVKSRASDAQVEEIMTRSKQNKPAAREDRKASRYFFCRLVILKHFRWLELGGFRARSIGHLMDVSITTHSCSVLHGVCEVSLLRNK